jgi:hypothetical protein
VRVTIEGEAYHPSGDDRTLIVVRQDGGKIVFPSSAEGVTVEDIVPPRVWTDGDVIHDPDNGETFTRVDGKWRSSHSPHSLVSDELVTLWVKDEAEWLVLRYQVGDL